VATANDVTGGYDPNRRTADLFTHHHLRSSPPSAPVGFTHHSLGGETTQRDRCPSWPGDYWPYSAVSAAACDATVTSSCEARRRYHVTTPSPVDNSAHVIKTERLSAGQPGMVAYAGQYTPPPNLMTLHQQCHSTRRVTLIHVFLSKTLRRQDQ